MNEISNQDLKDRTKRRAWYLKQLYTMWRGAPGPFKTGPVVCAILERFVFTKSGFISSQVCFAS